VTLTKGADILRLRLSLMDTPKSARCYDLIFDTTAYCSTFGYLTVFKTGGTYRVRAA